MKKLLALFIVFMMVIGVVGCSGTKTEETNGAKEASQETTETSAIASSEEVVKEEVSTIALDGSWPTETVKIGFEAFDTTDEQFLAIQTYYESLAEHFNIELIYSESIQSAEDELKFIENCASAGCSAIIGYYNVSEGQAVQLAADKGMYYWGGADKESIYDNFSTNEYYLGGYDGGDVNYLSGYEMAKALIDKGCEKLVYTSGGRDFGIDFFIDRSAGFYAAVEEAQKDNPNIEVVYDVSGWPGTDSFTADQTKVCDMDIDGIGNSFSALVWIQPLQSVGKFETVKLTTIGNANEAYVGLMGAGSVVAIVYENEEVQFGGAIPAILNAVNGDNDVNRNDGQALNYYVEQWLIGSFPEINAIAEKHNSGEYYVTPEEVAQCIKAFNKDASGMTYTEVYSPKTSAIILQ